MEQIKHRGMRQVTPAVAAVLAAYIGMLSVGYLGGQIRGMAMTKVESILVFGLAVHCFRKLVSQFSRYREPGYWVISVLFVSCWVLAAELDARDRVLFENTAGVFLAIASLSVPGAMLLEKVERLLRSGFSHGPMQVSGKDRGVFLKYWLVIFLCWLPVLLAYYPGLFNYDAQIQVRQGLKGAYLDHHPLIHTLLLYGFYALGGQLGSYNLGFLLYTLVQMLALAASFAWLMLYLYRCGIRRGARLSVLVLICVLPFVSMLVISATKDVLFSAFFLVGCVCLCMLREETAPKSTAYLYIGSIAAACLFRNNAIYSLAVFAAAALLLGRKKYAGLVRLTVLGILAAVLVNQALVIAVDADKGSVNEMLSVPYQQLSRVAVECGEELTYEELAQISEISPNYPQYHPELADFVKNPGRFTVNTGNSVKVYLKYMIRYPADYLSAFLLTSRGFWDVFDISHAQIYGTGNRQGYLLSDMKPGFDIEHISLLPPLENLYETLFTENQYQQIPVVHVIFSPAFYLWLILSLAVFAWRRKGEALGLPFLYVLSYAAGLFLGPCSLIRYALPYIICVPVLCCAAFRKEAAQDPGADDR